MKSKRPSTRALNSRHLRCSLDLPLLLIQRHPASGSGRELETWDSLTRRFPACAADAAVSNFPYASPAKNEMPVWKLLFLGKMLRVHGGSLDESGPSFADIFGVHCRHDPLLAVAYWIGSLDMLGASDLSSPGIAPGTERCFEGGADGPATKRSDRTAFPVDSTFPSAGIQWSRARGSPA